MPFASNQGIAVQRPSALMAATQETLVIRLEEAAQNLTNAGTVGYQAFKSKLVEVLQRSVDGRLISTIKVDRMIRDTTSGAIKKTNNPFDFAITGKGYFKIRTPEGIRYTRNGQFRTNEDGLLVNAHGHAVLSENDGDIRIGNASQDFSVASSGTVSVQGESRGRIGVAYFANEQAMKPDGFTLFKTSEPAITSPDAHITQSALEESNVSSVEQAIKLMEINQLWQHVISVLQAYDEAQKRTINVSGKGG